MRPGPAWDGDASGHRARLSALIEADPARMAILRVHRTLALPESWIGAGFVRNAVWDRLHDRPPRIDTDIDVVWFDPDRAEAPIDRALEEQLRALSPDADWSVSNQARMHRRNGDPPYRSTADALRFWPETATAVAVRLRRDERIELLAPFGLHDLFALRLCPTPGFRGERRAVFEARIRDRNWLQRWPALRLATT